MFLGAVAVSHQRHPAAWRSRQNPASPSLEVNPAHLTSAAITQVVPLTTAEITNNIT